MVKLMALNSFPDVGLGVIDGVAPTVAASAVRVAAGVNVGVPVGPAVTMTGRVPVGAGWEIEDPGAVTDAHPAVSTPTRTAIHHDKDAFHPIARLTPIDDEGPHSSARPAAPQRLLCCEPAPHSPTQQTHATRGSCQRASVQSVRLPDIQLAPASRPTAYVLSGRSNPMAMKLPQGNFARSQGMQRGNSVVCQTVRARPPLAPP